MELTAKQLIEAVAYNSSSELRLQTFVDDVLTAPDSIEVQVYKPDGTALFETAATPVAVSTGESKLEITAAKIDQRGKWTSVWSWTHDVVVEGEDDEEDETTTYSHQLTELFYVLQDAYCTASDIENLKLPGAIIGDDVDVSAFVQQAADEMNIALKSIYVVPIVSTNPDDHRILRSINTNLGAARLVAALAASSENESIYAYARSLEKQAISGYEADESVLIPGLKAIVQGVYRLEGATVRSDRTTSSEKYVGVSAPSSIDRQGNVQNRSPFANLYGDTYFG